MMELTSTTFDMKGLNILNSWCKLDTTAIDKFLISALLRSKIFITNLVINNATNPFAFLLSSSMNITGGEMS